jgi:UDP-galactopyranose mutase
MANVLVLGAGFAGATSAYLLSKKNHKVTILEGQGHPGGGCWTKFYADHPYTYGPRVFFSRDEEVYKHLSDLIKIRKFYTRTWSYVEKDQQLYHYPIQQDDLKLMKDYAAIADELKQTKNEIIPSDSFETYWIKAIGPTLYRKFMDEYSRKMWSIDSNKELVVNFNWVNKGTPIRNGDDRLYTDQFQGYPEDNEGYNNYFRACLKDTDIVYDCQITGFDPQKRIVKTLKGNFTGDIIVNTIHIDTLFEYCHGKLKFSGREFLKLVLPAKHAFAENITWIHYTGNEPFTRVTEFKKITNFQSNFTLLGIELLSQNNRLYPVQSKPELKRYKKYQNLFPENFYSIGRLGTFRYKGIEDAIREALDITEVIG